MSKLYSSRKKKYMAEMNVVPFIDVMLVLLVIFMVATPLMNQGLDVDLPETETGQNESNDPDNRPIYVDISTSGEYAVYQSGEDFDPLDESTAIQRAVAYVKDNRNIMVIVRADKAVPHGTVLSMVSQLQLHGLTKLSYAVRALDQ